LFNDNGIKNGRVVYMPVSVPNEPFQRSSVLQKKFNISNDQIIILQFGWTKGSRFSVELAEMAQRFTQKWLLVLHGPAEDSVLKQIQEIDVNKRIIISQDLVPDNKIHGLISSAHIGLVLYPSFDFNHHLTAFASEKLALKLRSGLPIIAFKYPGYEIFEEKRCGILINSIEEIPDAIEKILKSYSDFSHNARDCFMEHYEFSKNIQEVVQLIDEMP
jgi:glycosyltransferase involved in cell wall biosynthesis